MDKVLLAVLVTVSFLVLIGLNQEVHAQEIPFNPELAIPPINFDVDDVFETTIIKIDLFTRQVLGPPESTECDPIPALNAQSPSSVELNCQFEGWTNTLVADFDVDQGFTIVRKNSDTLEPRGFDIDSNGILFIVHQDFVIKSTTSGNFIEKWSTETDPDEFNAPFGLVINSLDEVIVTDALDHHVKVFSSSGGLLNLWGSEGTGAGEFDRPDEVTVDLDNNVYVVDHFNNRIQKFDQFGNFLLMFGWGVDTGASNHEICTSSTTPCQAGSSGSGDGQFGILRSIEYDSVQDRIWIGDGNRIQFFTRDGEFIGQITDVFGAFRASGISSSGDGSVFVSDDMNNRILKLSSGGTPLGTFGSSGDGPDKFQSVDNLLSIVLGGEFPELYVSDQDRILKISLFIECGKTWIGGSGNWGVAGNWEPSGIPDGTEKICIDGNFAVDSIVTLNFDFTLTTGSLEIGFNDKLIITNGDTLTNNSGETIRNSGSIENFGTISNTGTFINEITGEIVNKGLIVNSGTITNEGMPGVQSATIKNEGIINNNPGGTINNKSPGHSVRNLAGIQNEGTINNSGIIINSGGVVFQNRIDIPSGIDNSGTIINSNLFTTSGTFLNSGSIDNSVGTINTDLGGTIANSGTIDNTSGNINNAGIFQNDCTGIVQGFQISVTENRFTGTLVELICRQSGEINDFGLGGNTLGLVAERDYIVKIEKLFVGPYQIRITAFPDPMLGPNQVPTQITECGGARITFGQTGGIEEFYCSTVTMQVIQGTVEVEFFTSGDPITTILNAGQAVTYDEQTILITADPNNTEDIIIEINGKQITIRPGENILLEIDGPPIDDGVVGGEIIPIETTSLLLASAQSFSWMIPVVLSVLGIGLILVRRKY